jgi:diguanylate cyclase (GGDEF)-like protein
MRFANRTSSRELAFSGYANTGTSILVASPDPLLLLDLDRILTSLGLRVETLSCGDETLAALAGLEDDSVLLLDTRLPGMRDSRLLAALQESGIHHRCAIALIADQVSDEWIARLREGAIDDIVPRSADAATWNTHLNTMRRGHRLYCELETLRANVAMEVQHDRVTGVFNRETMLSLLFRETDRVQRLRGSLCLVLFEVDDADHWTAELPSHALDNLLREICNRTGRVLRSYDLLGRTGKFQFLLALPGCSPIHASMLAERMQLEVFGETFPATSRPAIRPIRLTACFGIASSRGRSPVVVLREAEQTLVHAQQSGPGAMRCAGELPQRDDARLDLLFPDACVLI